MGSKGVSETSTALERVTEQDETAKEPTLVPSSLLHAAQQARPTRVVAVLGTHLADALAITAGKIKVVVVGVDPGCRGWQRAAQQQSQS